MLGTIGDKTILTPVDPAAKDWNAAMVKGNGWYDRLVEVGRKPTYAERMQAARAVEHDLGTQEQIRGLEGRVCPHRRSHHYGSDPFDAAGLYGRVPHRRRPK